MTTKLTGAQVSRVTPDQLITYTSTVELCLGMVVWNMNRWLGCVGVTATAAVMFWCAVGVGLWRRATLLIDWLSATGGWLRAHADPQTLQTTFTPRHGVTSHQHSKQTVFTRLLLSFREALTYFLLAKSFSCDIEIDVTSIFRIFRFLN